LQFSKKYISPCILKSISGFQIDIKGDDFTAVLEVTVKQTSW